MLEPIKEHFQLILTLCALISILFPIFKWILKINTGMVNVEANINKIIEELTPNSGCSIKDKINKLESEYIEHKKIIDNIYHMQKWLLDLSDKMLFKTDTNGMWTWVNESLGEKLKQKEPFLLNAGWRNYISPSDRKRVNIEWDRCIRDKKNICIICSFIVPDIKNNENVIHVAIIANILNDGTYAGWIRRTKNTLISTPYCSYDDK